MIRISCFPTLVLSVFSFLSAVLGAPVVIGPAGQQDLVGPSQFGEFGSVVVPLSTGNIVVTDPFYDVPGPSPINNAGAVFLFNGKTFEVISILTGDHQGAGLGSRIFPLTNGNFVVAGGIWSAQESQFVDAVRLCSGVSGCAGMMHPSNSLMGNDVDDYVGAVITPLINGNYVVSSPNWDNGTLQDVGAVTLCSGTSGCIGVVSEANSLIGSHFLDKLGGVCDPCRRGVVPLPNGNYVVASFNTNGLRGSVTFGNGITGVTGVVSAANSLVGNAPNDQIGSGVSTSVTGVTVLPTSDYVVSSPSFDSKGAATFCDGNAGCAGIVSSANSLVGSTQFDSVGEKIVPIGGNKYIVGSPIWDNNGIRDAGAATFCSGPCIGQVSSSNSLVGTAIVDKVGFDAKALPTGNYVVISPEWNGNSGAVTFGNGVTGTIGPVSSSNSLVGAPFSIEFIGQDGVTVLANGNYVVNSARWGARRGAATFCSGVVGRTGPVNEFNSLVGTTPLDKVGSAKTYALTNGNYVVSSTEWNGRRGAATFCNGTSGCAGPVSSENSLVGSNPDDLVGSPKALANGNYVVTSPDWNGTAGAATWGNGNTGISGPVSPANSLIGTSPGQVVAIDTVIPLPNGNYVVNSSRWDNAGLTQVGAVTFLNGNQPYAGVISQANSLIGTQQQDLVGYDSNFERAGGGVFVLSDGSFVVRSRYWNNGNLSDAGAVTFGSPSNGVSGTISSANSVVGQYAGVPTDKFFYVEDPKNHQVIVGQPRRNRITVVKLSAGNSFCDFDGDGKTDVSIFRPTAGEWWYSKSGDGSSAAAQFGSVSDTITPADFTGDGKTDLGFWRPSTGEWYVLRSEDSTYYAVPFGLANDVPAPADYDADGKADIAVFRPSNGLWYIGNSSGGTRVEAFGTSGDSPVPADYDGDGKADVAIYRASVGQWWIHRSTAGTTAFSFGSSSDKTVHGDYTGDGKSDAAFWRPSTGEWFVLRSDDLSYFSVPFGTTGDIPAPGDYDGDGRNDRAVFRTSSNIWYVDRSSAGILIQQFGSSGDLPAPAAYVR